MYIIKNGGSYLTSINIKMTAQKTEHFTSTYSDRAGAIKIEDFGKAIVLRDLIQSWENNFNTRKAETVTIEILKKVSN